MLQKMDEQHGYGTRAARGRGGAEGHGVDLRLQAKLEGGVPGGVWVFCLWDGRVLALWGVARGVRCSKEGYGGTLMATVCP